jgi:uroporphyrinogen-III synthase
MMTCRSAGGSLDGRLIVITRPARQAQPLAKLIEEVGGRALQFPVLEIRDPRDFESARAAVARLTEFDLAVFISPTAVERAMALIGGPWPARLRLAAIGAGTARALSDHGVAGIIAPDRGGDSEALLALPELKAVSGKNIVIFCGEGGRELLGDTLRARGAEVQRAPCYRRVRPETDPAPLFALWQRNALDAVVVTSSEGLRNLVAMVGSNGKSLLAATPLFVPHSRIEETGRALGLRRIVLTQSGDQGLFAGLVKWFGEIHYT